jgi:hypothetical protein
MIPKYVLPVAFLLVLCLLVVWWWRQILARKRFLAAIKAMADGGRNEISGQPVEHWLDILNQDATQNIAAMDTMVLTYKGQEFFFVDALLGYVTGGKSSYQTEKACLLIAVGQPAVRLLSEDECVFRKITGSTELAAFSIFRWSDFAYMLMAERK